jgi:hypothetical protein
LIFMWTGPSSEPSLKNISAHSREAAGRRAFFPAVSLYVEGLSGGYNFQ